MALYKFIIIIIMFQADAAYVLTRWQHYYAGNDVMAAILNV